MLKQIYVPYFHYILTMGDLCSQGTFVEAHGKNYHFK